MRTSTHFGIKNFGFFEIYGMFAWTRGVNFSRFYVNIFYGWLLTMFNMLNNAA